VCQNKSRYESGFRGSLVYPIDMHAAGKKINTLLDGPFTAQHARCRSSSRIEAILASHDHAGRLLTRSAATEPQSDPANQAAQRTPFRSLEDHTPLPASSNTFSCQLGGCSPHPSTFSRTAGRAVCSAREGSTISSRSFPEDVIENRIVQR